MQLKRWIVNAIEVSTFSHQNKIRLFFLYLKLCFLHDKDREAQFNPLTITLEWNGQEFDFFVREKLDLDALLHIFKDAEYALDKIPEPEVIIDCGSNIGVTVIQFKLLWPNSRIIAIEPDPNNVIALTKNVEQFGDSVSVINKAASSSDNDTLDFYLSKKGHMSSSIVKRRDDDTKCTVETITLDTILRLNNIEHVDLLKFDVEGSEYKLWQGLTDKGVVSYIAGELHKDLIPEGFEEFMDKFLLDFKVIDGLSSIENSAFRKPVILGKNKKL